MKIIYKTGSLVVCIFLSCYSKNPDKPIFKKESPFISSKGTPLGPIKMVHNKDNFLKAVDTTYDYLSKLPLSKFVKFHVGIFEKLGITVDQVRYTLGFIKHLLEENPEQLDDIHFLEQNFDFYRWRVVSDHGHLLHGHYGPPDYIRTTTYLIASIPGSSVRTGSYIIPLYSVPSDEKNMTPGQITEKQKDLLRFKYTRQEIIDGALENRPEVTVLGWVTLEDYKEIAKQGSGIINFEKGITKLCCVAKKNEKPGKDSYYFFSFKDKSIDSKRSKFPIKPDPVEGVTLAGNIEGLGLGKLFFMVSPNYHKNYLEGRFGLLTDTGAAFKDNFHQVDMFAGYFADRIDFQKHIVGLPHTAKMYMMIKKPPHN